MTNNNKLDYILVNLISQTVECTTVTGSVYAGVFAGITDTEERDTHPPFVKCIVLGSARIVRFARLADEKNAKGDLSSPANLSEFLTIPIEDIVLVEATNITTFKFGDEKPPQRSFIPQKSQIASSIEDLDWYAEPNEKAVDFDQFKVNKELHGYTSTYSETDYTTPLDEKKRTKEEIAFAEFNANQIERGGVHLDEDLTKSDAQNFSDVAREPFLKPVPEGTKRFVPPTRRNGESKLSAETLLRRSSETASETAKAAHPAAAPRAPSTPPAPLLRKESTDVKKESVKSNEATNSDHKSSSTTSQRKTGGSTFNVNAAPFSPASKPDDSMTKKTPPPSNLRGYVNSMLENYTRNYNVTTELIPPSERVYFSEQLVEPTHTHTMPIPHTGSTSSRPRRTPDATKMTDPATSYSQQEALQPQKIPPQDVVGSPENNSEQATYDLERVPINHSMPPIHMNNYDNSYVRSDPDMLGYYGVNNYNYNNYNNSARRPEPPVGYGRGNPHQKSGYYNPIEPGNYGRGGGSNSNADTIQGATDNYRQSSFGGNMGYSNRAGHIYGPGSPAQQPLSNVMSHGVGMGDPTWVQGASGPNQGTHVGQQPAVTSKSPLDPKERVKRLRGGIR